MGFSRYRFHKCPAALLCRVGISGSEFSKETCATGQSTSVPRREQSVKGRSSAVQLGVKGWGSAVQLDVKGWGSTAGCKGVGQYSWV